MLLKKPWVEALEGHVQGVKQRVEEARQRVGAVARELSERRAPSGAAVSSKEPSAQQPSAQQASARQGSSQEPSAKATTAVRAVHEDPLAEVPDLPVVARLIVEIRSDGSRTLARGALEDVVTGERVSLEANGGSPAQLAASLAGSLLSTPFALGRYARAVVRQRLRRGDGER